MDVSITHTGGEKKRKERKNETTPRTTGTKRKAGPGKLSGSLRLLDFLLYLSSHTRLFFLLTFFSPFFIFYFFFFFQRELVYYPVNSFFVFSCSTRLDIHVFSPSLFKTTPVRTPTTHDSDVIVTWEFKRLLVLPLSIGSSLTDWEWRHSRQEFCMVSTTVPSAFFFLSPNSTITFL